MKQRTKRHGRTKPHTRKRKQRKNRKTQKVNIPCYRRSYRRKYGGGIKDDAVFTSKGEVVAVIGTKVMSENAYKNPSEINPTDDFN